MVFDPQLGYDPEEWEECPPPDHFLAFSFPTRVALSVAAVLFSIAFFWVLEARKKWVQEDRRESILNLATPLVKEAVVQRRASVAVSGAFWEGTGVSRSRKNIVATPLSPLSSLPLADLERTVEETEERERSRSSSSTRRRRGSGKPRTPLTPDEKAKLHEWEREVERVAESRLRAAEKLGYCEDKPQLSALRESTLDVQPTIDHHSSPETVLSPSNPQSLLLPPKDPLKRLSSSHSRLLECVTPPSTPQSGVGTGVAAAGKKNSAAVADPQQRQMVADLEERLAEMEALSASSLPRGEGELLLEAQPAPKSSIVSADLNSGGWAESGDEVVIKSPSSDSKRNLLIFSSRDETDADQPARAGGPSPRSEKGSRSSEEDEFIKVQNYTTDVESKEVDAAGLLHSPSASPSRQTQPQHSFEGCSDNESKLGGTTNRRGGGTQDTVSVNEIEFVWQQKLADGHQQQARSIGTTNDDADDNSNKEGRVGSRTEESGSAASSISFPPSPLVVEEHENGYLVRPVSSQSSEGSFNKEVLLPKGSTDVSPLRIPDSLEEVASPTAVVIPTRSNVPEGEEKLIVKLLDEYYDVPAEIEDAVLIATRSCASSPAATEVRQQPQWGGLIEVPLTIDTADGAEERVTQQPSALLQGEHSPYDMADDDGELAKSGTASAIIASHLEWVDPILTQSPTSTPTGAYIVEEEMLESSDINIDDGNEDGSQPYSRFPDSSSKRSRARRKGEKRSRDEQEALIEEVVVKRDTLAVGSRGDGAASAEPTSRLVKTNEVFDRQEQLLFGGDEAEDAVTYAPEIESEEIPPDDQFKFSQNSLNLVENLDSERASPIGKTPSVAAEAPAAAADTAAKPSPAAPSLRPASMSREQIHTATESKILRSGGSSRDHLHRSPSPRVTHARMGKRPSAPHFLRNAGFDTTDSTPSTSLSMNMNNVMSSSLLNALGVSSTQEMLLKLITLDELSDAMRKAGLESTNLIFGIDYTASNKYQGERSFHGRSLHTVGDPSIENPYQQVIKIMGRTLAPFAAPDAGIPVFGFGDSTTGDWSVFPLNGPEAECRDLDEVLRVYNEVTPYVDLSGPTNFAPLIHKAVDVCKIVQDYHILVIIADGQVTNERATRKAIVSACQYPLSIIVVGVGDGPWDMMRLFDESLPKRPWDNFHFVEFNEIINEHTRNVDSAELSLAIHSLLEIPDQYNHVRRMGMVLSRRSTRQITPIEEGCGPDANGGAEVGENEGEGGFELETDV